MPATFQNLHSQVGHTGSSTPQTDDVFDGIDMNSDTAQNLLATRVPVDEFDISVVRNTLLARPTEIRARYLTSMHINVLLALLAHSSRGDLARYQGPLFDAFVPKTQGEGNTVAQQVFDIGVRRILGGARSAKFVTAVMSFWYQHREHIDITSYPNLAATLCTQFTAVNTLDAITACPDRTLARLLVDFTAAGRPLTVTEQRSVAVTLGLDNDHVGLDVAVDSFVDVCDTGRAENRNGVAVLRYALQSILNKEKDENRHDGITRILLNHTDYVEQVLTTQAPYSVQREQPLFWALPSLAAHSQEDDRFVSFLTHDNPVVVFHTMEIMRALQVKPSSYVCVSLLRTHPQLVVLAAAHIHEADVRDAANTAAIQLAETNDLVANARFVHDRNVLWGEWLAQYHVPSRALLEYIIGRGSDLLPQWLSGKCPANPPTVAQAQRFATCYQFARSNRYLFTTDVTREQAAMLEPFISAVSTADLVGGRITSPILLRMVHDYVEVQSDSSPTVWAELDTLLDQQLYRHADLADLMRVWKTNAQ